MSVEQSDSSVTTASSPQSQAAHATALRPKTEIRPEVLVCLMELADRYRAENSIRQAMEIYFELVEDYDDTPQAQQARDRLMEIAEEYECAGKRHHARGMYERLL